MNEFLAPSQIKAIMADFGSPWAVAGGWAIDLFLEKETRPHRDIEIAVFRDDQAALHDHLSGWILEKVVGGESSIWRPGERLTLPTHEIQCRNAESSPPRFEVLLNEREDAQWVYRRDLRVRRALPKTLQDSKMGVKFICPEIVLLYKSKNPRPHDLQDFEAAVGRLDAEQKVWLKRALALASPDHAWSSLL
jgi:hypothetical protein